MVILALVACQDADEHKTVICIPVYGQSLAIGVDAIRVTDFDSLANYRKIWIIASVILTSAPSNNSSRESPDIINGLLN